VRDRDRHGDRGQRSRSRGRRGGKGKDRRSPGRRSRRLGEQIVDVTEIDFGLAPGAQELGDKFESGQPLQELLDKLLQGQVDPLNAPFLKLKCMEHRGSLLCANNKRLKCLKDYQSKVPQKVLVRIEVTEPKDKEFENFLHHFTNNDMGKTTVRRPSRPRGKGDKGKGTRKGGKDRGKGKDRGSKGKSKDGRRPSKGGGKGGRGYAPGPVGAGGKGRNKGSEKGKGAYEEDFNVEQGYQEDGYPEDGYREDGYQEEGYPDDGYDAYGQTEEGNYGDDGWEGDQGYGGDDQFYEEGEGGQWDEAPGDEPYDPEAPA